MGEKLWLNELRRIRRERINSSDAQVINAFKRIRLSPALLSERAKNSSYIGIAPLSPGHVRTHVSATKPDLVLTPRPQVFVLCFVAVILLLAFWAVAFVIHDSGKVVLQRTVVDRPMITEVFPVTVMNVTEVKERIVEGVSENCTVIRDVQNNRVFRECERK